MGEKPHPLISSLEEAKQLLAARNLEQPKQPAADKEEELGDDDLMELDEGEELSEIDEVEEKN